MQPDDNSLFFQYKFILKDKPEINFQLRLDPVTLEYLPPEPHNPDEEWTTLQFNKCEGCTLPDTEKYCPIARNLAPIITTFQDFESYIQVDVQVTTNQRSYLKKDIALQEGLSSMLGIVMVTSGCPVLDWLRPMVRYHLPFASIEETLYRATSMYMLAQYFRKQAGLEPDMEMVGLIRIYRAVYQVNVGICHRLRAAARRDAGLNAVVILDAFAQMLPMSIEEALEELKPYFQRFLDHEAPFLTGN